jgi:hypothetical protein
VQAHDIPLQGISADLKEPGADTIMIRVGSAAGGYLTHWIRHPARVILEQTPEVYISLQQKTLQTNYKAPRSHL